MKRVLNIVCAAAATLATFAAAGCTDTESATDLNPEGPPMVQQVRLKETYTIGGSTTSRRVFGFGQHPMASETDAHPVATASASGNSLRVIMDELLIGNNIEEIACRGSVDNDAYARVPLGATPDDIARCAAAQDVLPRSCAGEYAVCLCELDGGCVVGSTMIEKGGPVGVLDINQDGAADDSRMIPGAVGLRCGSIDVPVDLDMSYWNPSGNQQVPAMGGFEALGPAIVVVPQRGLPTNLPCNLTFSPEVVDKQGEQVCTPPGGDITADCTPGDLSGFTFTVEAFELTSALFADGATGVSRTDPAVFIGNTTIDPASITGITVAPVAAFTATVTMNRNLQLTWTDGLAALTEYTITIPTTVTDTFGQPLPQPFVISFTTGA